LRYAAALCAIFQLALISSAAAETSQPRHRVYTTAEAANAGHPATASRAEFDCAERIFLVLELEQARPGRHTLEVLWRDPDGKRRERTHYPFTVGGGADARVWAWLRLHPGSGHYVDRWLFQDESAGLRHFAGQWLARVYLNGRLLDETEFLVTC